MKKLLSFCFVFITICTTNAQKIKKYSCSTDNLHWNLLEKNSKYKEIFEKSNQDWQLYAPAKKSILENSNNRPVPLQSPVTLSVVFHNMVTQSLPYTGVYDPTVNFANVIANLNTVFSGISVSPTRPSDISFCLVTKDINGDKYVGNQIQHFTSISNLDSNQDAQINQIWQNSNSLIKFPRAKYINVYVVDGIVDPVAGFAYMPPNHGNDNDGIYMERQWLKNANPNDIKILAHEMGHYLGLFHVFGICKPGVIGTLTDASGYNPCSCDNGNCLFNGDMVCDTPPSMINSVAPFNSCHTDNLSTFNDGLMPLTDINDDKSNYMDYGLQSGQDHFTRGQILRMQFMIDPQFGPRKTLLGVAACTDCISMEGCTFNITPAPSFNVADVRQTITQIATGTPTVVFTASKTCSTLISGLTYSWSLELLNTNTIIGTTLTGATFSTTAGLVAGNYKLTLTSGTSVNCYETTIYNFVIVPIAGNCNLNLPASNSDWTGWKRISFQDGWVRSNVAPLYPYIYGNAPAPIVHGPKLAGEAGFDATGFDVLSPSALSDVNYPSSPAGLPSSITKIMRVGRVVGGDPIPSGSAYYAKVTIPINSSNCKYRVWYLGTTEGVQNDVKFPFHLNNGVNDTSFGFMSKYLYNSPVNTISTANNSIIGFDENGNLVPSSWNGDLRANNLVSQSINDSSLNYNTSLINHRMPTWKSIDLDYSEFVNLPPQTDIVLTFFSHSNATTGNAFKNSYAYYGIECLGGGLPQDFDFTVPDISANCSSPGINNSIQILLPRIKYGINALYFDANNGYTHNFSSLKLLIKEPATGTYVNQTFTTAVDRIIFSLSTVLAPYAECRLIYKTLHKTIIKDFRVFIGFGNNLQDCTTGDKIDSTKHPNGGDIIVDCNTFPTLFLTPTCVTSNFKYQWTQNGIDIVGQTAATLNLNDINIGSNCPTYNRKTLYKEPYCDNTKIKISETFKVYTLNKMFISGVDYSAPNICFGETYQLNVNNFSLYNQFCIIPTNIYDNSITTFNVQMVSNGIPIGTVHTFNITGQIITGLNLGNFNLTFNNLNAQGQPYFVPTATTNTFPIDIRLTGNYLGCAIDKTFSGVQRITFNDSAIGGNIAHTTNCAASTITTTSSNAGATNNNQYVWEYSHSPTFADDINVLTGQTGATISNIATTAFGASPAYLRRKSLPFSNCPNATYSNILIINPTIVTPNFPTSYTVCTGDASPLPTISSNQVTGTWSPAYTPNTSRTYTFTAAAGQCVSGTIVTVQVIVTPKIATTFTNSNLSLCQNQLPYTLPLTDNAGNTGTWKFNNLTTTTANVAGIYTFTPNGTCVTSGNLAITINSINQPIFSLLNEYCVGSTVPLSNTSNNNIAGFWHLGTGTANLTSVNTSTAGTFTYNFVSNTIANCQNYSITITIKPYNIIPTFGFLTAVCYGNEPPILPNISNNTDPITGTWSPEIVNNTATANYTFTPDAGQCVNPVTITINVNICSISLYWHSEVSCPLADGSEAPGKYTADIVDGPCIRVCENSIITYSLISGGAPITSTDWIVTGGTIISSSPLECTVQWNSVNFCLLKGLIHLDNGATLEINKCIERLQAPTAAFGVYPNPDEQAYEVCLNAPVNFLNFSTSSDGETNLYYRWDFGDGNSSTETNPTHLYNQIGDYEVSLLVYNGCSCTSKIIKTVHVQHDSVVISCPSVVCQGSTNSYSIPESFGDCNDLEWTAIGGTVLSTELNSTKVKVHWNNPNSQGFGYLSVTSNNCLSCIAPVKIPIITQESTILGSTIVCANSQSVFSLPQWPTTIFTWSIVDNGTGATLIQNHQRNQVIIKAGSSGLITLKCNYFNTLLGCGGTASINVNVNSKISLDGNLNVCANTLNIYKIIDESGANVNGFNWTMISPTGVVYNGSESPFNYTFNELGTYLFNIDGNISSTCFDFKTITVKSGTTIPSQIIGPNVVCPSIATVFSVAPQVGVITHWEVTGGVIIGGITTGNNISVLFNPSQANYTIKTWNEAQNGCLSAVLIKTITRDNPVLTISDNNNNTNNTVECGSNFQTYIVNNINASSYIWSIVPPSAGSIEQGQNTTIVKVLWNQPQNGGQVNAIVKLIAKKCSADKLKTFNVNIIATPIVTLTSPDNICATKNFNASFTLNPGTVFTSAIWDFGDGSPLVTTSYPINYINRSYSNIDSVANYLIKVTVIGAFSCVLPVIQFKAIVVSPMPVVKITPFIGSCGGAPTLSSPPRFFTITMQGGFAATNFIQWYFNDMPVAAILGGNNAVLNYNQVGLGHGDYYATVNNSFGCVAKTEVGTFHECFGNCDELLEAQLIDISCNKATFQLTQIPPTATSVTWTCQNINGNGLPITGNNVFEINDLEPGRARIYISTTNSSGLISCGKELFFTIPYKANLKYNTTCLPNNMYKVSILDFSEFLTDTPIQNYSFTYDNGNNWYLGTIVNGVHQLEVNLPPGTHNIGIKISRLGSPECFKIIPLVLQPKPIATFHFNNNVCQGSAMQFYADDTSQGLRYDWSFSDSSHNLQRDPVKTFPLSVSNWAQLTVTNASGCSTTSPIVNVTVFPVALRGKLSVNPSNACEGTLVNISYQVETSPEVQDTPVLYKWYKNLNDSPPFSNYLFATTTVPNLTVTQSGAYFVYVTDVQGCSKYDNPPISVNLNKKPQAPRLTGETAICKGNNINLYAEPTSNSFQYLWTLNGIAKPDWNGFNTINFEPQSTGNYIFSCVIHSLTSNSNCANSPPTSYTVAVYPEPDIPILNVYRVSCDPYVFKVKVINPQSGVNYYWSNGATGTSTLMYHGGPLLVTARSLNCSNNAQIDLPEDINAFKWMFPAGCFELCSDSSGYLVNAQYDFENWKWIENDNTILSGSGPVNNLEVLQPYHNYQLSISNGYCEKTISNISITKKECKKCDFTFDKLEAIPIKVDGNCLFKVNMYINNPYPIELSGSITAPNGEGLFVNTSFTILPGSNLYYFLFYPTDPNLYANVNIEIHATSERIDCKSYFNLNFKNYCTSPKQKSIDSFSGSYNEDLEENMLLLAPNPAQESTTIFYSFENKTIQKTIEISDMIGRILLTLPLNEESGNINLDCTQFAKGNYLVLMKENSIVIKNSKLVVN